MGLQAPKPWRIAAGGITCAAMDHAPAPLSTTRSRREAEIARFAARRYGIRGTLALHRHALGADILRAPLNVALAPVALIAQLLAAGLRRAGARRAGGWLASRRIFLRSDIATRIEDDLTRLMERLDEAGLAPAVSPERRAAAIRAHAETRNAVAEITTSLFVLMLGLVLFNRATPGLISLAGPMAQMRAHGAAVRDFALGDTLGRAWYWAFPVELSPLYVLGTGVVLALIGSLVTTFAGLIADPVQLWTGIHRRRLMRMLDRLDAMAEDGPEPEQFLARGGDIADVASILWRSLRG